MMLVKIYRRTYNILRNIYMYVYIWAVTKTLLLFSYRGYYYHSLLASKKCFPNGQWGNFQRRRSGSPKRKTEERGQRFNEQKQLTSLYPHKTNEWIPKLMGWKGKGDSCFKYGRFLVSMLNFWAKFMLFLWSDVQLLTSIEDVPHMNISDLAMKPPRPRPTIVCSNIIKIERPWLCVHAHDDEPIGFLGSGGQRQTNKKK